MASSRTGPRSHALYLSALMTSRGLAKALGLVIVRAGSRPPATEVKPGCSNVLAWASEGTG